MLILISISISQPTIHSYIPPATITQHLITDWISIQSIVSISKLIIYMKIYGMLQGISVHNYIHNNTVASGYKYKHA